MSNSINYCDVASASRTMAGDIGSGRNKGATEDGDNQNPGFNITDSVEKGNSGDMAVLLKEIESLKRQMAELQASSGKEQSNKPESSDTNVKRSGFSAFTGFISGKIEEMKVNSEKRESEREAALKREGPKETQLKQHCLKRKELKKMQHFRRKKTRRWPSSSTKEMRA